MSEEAARGAGRLALVQDNNFRLGTDEIRRQKGDGQMVKKIYESLHDMFRRQQLAPSTLPVYR